MTNQATLSRTFCSSLPFQGIDHRALIETLFYLYLGDWVEKKYNEILFFYNFVSSNLFFRLIELNVCTPT